VAHDPLDRRQVGAVHEQEPIKSGVFQTLGPDDDVIDR
jgi:hypothetical protein